MPSKFSLALLALVFCFSSHAIKAQQNNFNPESEIRGVVYDKNGVSIPGISVMVIGTSKGTATDSEGSFVISSIKPGEYILVVSGVGFVKEQRKVMIFKGESLSLDFRLEEDTQQLTEVSVQGKSIATEIKERGFSVEAIETKSIRTQTVELNRVLDRTAGIRVRQSGGIGSDFQFMINGLSGRSIRFFIDGIPMDYFGSSYSINNFPVSLLSRIEVYKGVVPVSLGSDALGGAVNMVTRNDVKDHLEFSYSHGSFNTHMATVYGQWVEPNTNFTARISGFYNYSENNYKVWGPGVTFADESTGFRPVEFTKDNPAERFNDDFRTANVKADIGFTDKKWANQFFLGTIISDLDRGIQTGQTMAFVYGDARYREKTIIPYLSYQKSDLGKKGLDVNVFSAYSIKEGINVDTSRNVFDWRGEIITRRGNGGELSQGRGRSLFTLFENAWVNRVNATYTINDKHAIGINYVMNNVVRNGKDEFQPWYRTSFLEPQSLQTQVGGVSWQTKLFNDKFISDLFAKYYGFSAEVNESFLTTNSQGEQQYINRVIDSSTDNLGLGYAVSYRLSDQILLKSSIERSTRLPTTVETLGDGLTIQSNPNIRPEQSLNFNLGGIWKERINDAQNLKIGLSGFLRDTEDLLLFTITASNGNGIFQNVSSTFGKGLELEMGFNQKVRKHDFEFTANSTFLDMRNTQRWDAENPAVPNAVFGDRLRNTPYFMANAGLRYTGEDVFKDAGKLTAYWQVGYVHEFFLNWPSLGAANQKAVIPSQLANDVGIGYQFPKEKVALAFDVFNLFNQQLYDNFMLQKPGRALFIKLTYRII
ncbi:TonB-dependent receptor [Arthrospiribacter ruber]|uniref:TonB-dependent receptor n=1 Tax=Arthrospiribacter ruber TaxID=2487934 RepID=A0A951MEA3_9BACT|nr:TonB-dependent receptor [Arthrospiribacter ruber]MBW3469569.1 TonB-dependent receptor [Arthrospiribacter ruber]